MGWFKNWLMRDTPPPPPVHKCHFVKRYWIGGVCRYYSCDCGMVYGVLRSTGKWATSDVLKKRRLQDFP